MFCCWLIQQRLKNRAHAAHLQIVPDVGRGTKVLFGAAHFVILAAMTICLLVNRYSIFHVGMASRLCLRTYNYQCCRGWPNLATFLYMSKRIDIRFIVWQAWRRGCGQLALFHVLAWTTTVRFRLIQITMGCVLQHNVNVMISTVERVCNQ